MPCWDHGADLKMQDLGVRTIVEAIEFLDRQAT